MQSDFDLLNIIGGCPPILPILKFKILRLWIASKFMLRYKTIFILSFLNICRLNFLRIYRHNNTCTQNFYVRLYHQLLILPNKKQYKHTYFSTFEYIVNLIFLYLSNLPTFLRYYNNLSNFALDKLLLLIAFAVSAHFIVIVGEVLPVSMCSSFAIE